MTEILGHTRQAQKLSQRRNSIVHGVVVSDAESERFMLRFKNVDTGWDQAALKRLLSDLDTVVAGLTKHCYELEMALDTKRAEKSP